MVTDDCYCVSQGPTGAFTFVCKWVCMRRSVDDSCSGSPFHFAHDQTEKAADFGISGLKVQCVEHHPSPKLHFLFIFFKKLKIYFLP